MSAVDVTSACAPAERQLIARARAGDRLAFEDLVRTHAGRLYTVVLRLCDGPQEAEEVTQDAFLRAWRAIGRFDGRSQIFTWLYRIGMNEAARRSERRRRQIHTVPVDAARLAEVPDRGEGPGQLYERGEQRAALERAVRSLPFDYRAALILRDIEGLSTSEAAEALGIGEAALKSRLHRARVAVRDTLTHLVGEDRQA